MGKEGCWKGGIQEKREQEMNDGCRLCETQKERYIGKEGDRKEGIQERRDAELKNEKCTSFDLIGFESKFFFYLAS